MYQDRQEYSSYEFQPPISHTYAAGSTKEGLNNSSYPLSHASRSRQPEYYISVNVEDQEYQVHPSSGPDDYQDDHHHGQHDLDGAPSSRPSTFQNDQHYQNYPPKIYQDDLNSPVSSVEEQQPPFIPPPLHIQPVMYWTTAPSQTKEEEEYRTRLESDSDIDPSDQREQYGGFPQLEQGIIEEARYKQIEDDFERDGFEVTGSIISQKEDGTIYTGLTENNMEDRIGASKEIIENRHGLMEKVIDKGRHYSSERLSATAPQARKRMPNPITMISDIRRLPLIEKEQRISSPTIAINPNKFWKVLMKKNQSVQQSQQKHQQESTLNHVMPAPTKSSRMDPEEMILDEHSVKLNHDKEYSKKRNISSERTKRKKLVDYSKRKEVSCES